jgi:hypothetical protein
MRCRFQRFLIVKVERPELGFVQKLPVVLVEKDGRVPATAAANSPPARFSSS